MLSEHNINAFDLPAQDLDTGLYSANLRLALNPRILFNTFYQYNIFDKQGQWNLRLSWEYMPLSFIYLVFYNIQTDQLDPMTQKKQCISKITFLKQF